MNCLTKFIVNNAQQFSYYSNHLTWGIYEMRKIAADELSKVLKVLKEHDDKKFQLLLEKCTNNSNKKGFT